MNNLSNRKAFVWVYLFTGTILFLIISAVSSIALVQASSSSTVNKPLIILVDNSGSMGRCSVVDSNNKCILDQEQPYRIDIVKESIRKRIDMMDNESAKIGIVELGNWRAYGNDYRGRCEAVKPLVLPELGNKGQILSALQEIRVNSDGVTPIPFAINSVVNDIFRSKNLLPAKILLLTDGSPNCTSESKLNFCDIIAGLAARDVELTVDIAGYQASGKDDDFISCARKYANMVRYLGSASNPAELDGLINKVQELPRISQTQPSNPSASLPDRITVSSPNGSISSLPSGSSVSQPNQESEKNCFLKNLLAIIFGLLCAICIILLFVLTISTIPVGRNMPGMRFVKSLIPVDQEKVNVLLMSLTAIATILGSFATYIASLSC